MRFQSIIDVYEERCKIFKEYEKLDEAINKALLMYANNNTLTSDAVELIELLSFKLIELSKRIFRFESDAIEYANYQAKIYTAYLSEKAV